MRLGTHLPLVVLANAPQVVNNLVAVPLKDFNKICVE